MDMNDDELEIYLKSMLDDFLGAVNNDRKKHLKYIKKWREKEYDINKDELQ